MKFNDFLGNKVSMLGMGTMRLPCHGTGALDLDAGAALIRKGIDGGINYIDTAYFYHEGKAEVSVGMAVKGVRDKAFIADKSPSWMYKSENGFMEIFEEQLRRLDTDYIDFYLFHALDRGGMERMVKYKVWEHAQDLKRQDVIKHFGFSFHDTYDIYERAWKEYPWEFSQIQMNYLDIEHQAGIKGVQLSGRLNKPLIIMEPLLGGRLGAHMPAAIAEGFRKLNPARTPAEFALRFLAEMPEVTVILSGMSTEEQLAQNIALFSKIDSDRLNAVENEYLKDIRKHWDTAMLIPCTKCGYCAPCPCGVDIPACFEAFNTVCRAAADHDAAHKLYKALKESGKSADKCAACGACETHCPQGIKIIEKLREIKL
ncbi:MAG: aldo/keto reductase [Firmicutes bacterium]|nr:aldo/keto reductase [Bacillota bacterium]